MASSSDVRDILELDGDCPLPSSGLSSVSKRDFLFGNDKPKKKSNAKPLVKKPEGLSREVWGLLCTDARDPPPIVPTDTASAGYKQAKIKLGVQRVRPWRWTPFANPARKDSLVLNHWRRVADEGKEYPFARFNKEIDVQRYSDAEYAQHLHDENWSKRETDHLFDLAQRFDLRFVVMQDRYDTEKFQKRSVEDIKERYYTVSNALAKLRANPSAEKEKPYIYDADHERRRKDQLRKLWDRTPEEIDEEQSLISEMRKIEQRKKDRERRAGDLQKLLAKVSDAPPTPKSATTPTTPNIKTPKASETVDSNQSTPPSSRGPESKKLGLLKKKNRDSTSLVKQRSSSSEASLAVKDPNDNTGIRFSDFKTSGVTLRSQRIKLPSSVGQKKSKAIESMLTELGIDINPIPTEEIGDHFNELRSDMVLLYELKTAVANCEFELQTLRHRQQAALGGTGTGSATKVEDVSVEMEDVEEEAPQEEKHEPVAASSTPKTLGSIKGATLKTGVVKIDALKTGASPTSQKQLKKAGVPPVSEPQPKRKAALEQKNVLKTVLKNRSL